MEAQLNVFGKAIKPCCNDPVTGFFRDGFCHTDHTDTGVHTICILANEEFLDYSKSRGNDLSTPRPEYNFPGVRPGDKWCLCAGRWVEAYMSGVAPLVDLEATNEETLAIVSIETLERFDIRRHRD
ncbi:MAG: hypothetical protein CME71_12390 [Halobacteriovorax sp.]|nr:hypothetical protein [Halobacteriovorax sp.]